MAGASKRRKLWIAAGAGFVLLVIYLSLTPHPLPAPQWGGFKTGHVLAYAWLMFWYSHVYRSAPARVGIGVALVAMGIGLEYVQDLVGRDFSYTDMRDDGIGVAIGLALAWTPLAAMLPRIERTLIP